MNHHLAPGMRVVIRDEEWLVRRVDPSSDGGHLLSCDGISELVRGQEALFLTELEDEIDVLDPAQTQLIPDTSDKYSAALLYLESQRVEPSGFLVFVDSYSFSFGATPTPALLVGRTIAASSILRGL